MVIPSSEGRTADYTPVLCTNPKCGLLVVMSMGDCPPTPEENRCGTMGRPSRAKVGKFDWCSDFARNVTLRRVEDLGFQVMVHPLPEAA